MKFGFYDTIVKMADGDLIRVQQLYELPIMAVLNHLAYLSSGGFKKTS